MFVFYKKKRVSKSFIFSYLNSDFSRIKKKHVYRQTFFAFVLTILSLFKFIIKRGAESGALLYSGLNTLIHI